MLAYGMDDMTSQVFMDVTHDLYGDSGRWCYHECYAMMYDVMGDRGMKLWLDGMHTRWLNVTWV